MAAEGSADGAGACDFFEEVFFDPGSQGRDGEIAAEDQAVFQDGLQLIADRFRLTELDTGKLFLQLR